MSFTLRQLRYFIAVAETGKITDAALKVNISPSSVTGAVQELETNLGTKLLERSRSGVSLTFEGYRFLQSAKKVLSVAAEAKDSFKHISKDIEGKVVVASSITVSGYFLSNIFEGFSRAYPNIVLEFSEHSRVVVESKVAKGQVDIGLILTSNMRETSILESITLLRSTRNLWISANHPLASKDVVKLEDIAKENYIQLLIDEAEKTTISYWQDYGFKPNIYFKTESVEAVRNMVGIGAGVCILSDMVYRPWSLDGQRIETKPIAEAIPSMDTGLIWAKGQTVSEEVKLFIDFCRMQYTTGYNV